jgi:hypothetical protein
MKYGLLTVLETKMIWRAAIKQHRTQARCRCDCGILADVWMDNLKRGDTRSCGCLQSLSSSERMTLWHQKRREAGKDGPPARQKGKSIPSGAGELPGRLGHFRAVSTAELAERIKKAKTPAY